MAKIRQLPTPPSSSRPLNFNEEADAFVKALVGFVTDANALAADVENIERKMTDINSDINTKNDEATKKHKEIADEIAKFAQKYTKFQKEYDQILQAHQDINRACKCLSQQNKNPAKFCSNLRLCFSNRDLK